MKEKINKANRGIGLIIKLQSKLSRNALLTIYKSFIKLYLGYDIIVYGQPTNDSFSKKIEKGSTMQHQ